MTVTIRRRLGPNATPEERAQRAAEELADRLAANTHLVDAFGIDYDHQVIAPAAKALATDAISIVRAGGQAPAWTGTVVTDMIAAQAATEDKAERLAISKAARHQLEVAAYRGLTDGTL